MSRRKLTRAEWDGEPDGRRLWKHAADLVPRQLLVLAAAELVEREAGSLWSHPEPEWEAAWALATARAWARGECGTEALEAAAGAADYASNCEGETGLRLTQFAAAGVAYLAARPAFAPYELIELAGHPGGAEVLRRLLPHTERERLTWGWRERGEVALAGDYVLWLDAGRPYAAWLAEDRAAMPPEVVAALGA